MLDTAEILKEKGLKVTPQRLAIYNLLRDTDAHPTAETIYNSISLAHPYISLATVYKTLDTLTKAGLAEELNVGEGRFRYDANMQPHHHMFCTCCHTVYDLPLMDSLKILEQELKIRTDFNVTATKLYFYGTCKDCPDSMIVAR